MATSASTLLLTPVVPARARHGLAMRAGMLLEILAARNPVDLVVLPVWNGSWSPEWAALRARRVTVLTGLATADRAACLRRVAVDRAGWDVAASTLPWPETTWRAAPDAAPAVIDAATSGGGSPALVVALRLYLTPLATAVATRLGAPLVVDADDDDGAYHRARGAVPLAAAFDRLGALSARRAVAVTLASPVDTDAFRRRHGGSVHHLPNARLWPDAPPTRLTQPPGATAAIRLLFVSNLRYAPNRDGLAWLVQRVLPAVHRMTGRRVELTVIGAIDDGLPRAALRSRHGVDVRVLGFVDELALHYAAADVAVVPVLRGSGTRLKVIEAFAEGTPVVATSVGATGLGARHGVHLLLGDNPAAFARAVADTVTDRDAAAARAAAAFALGRETLSLDAAGRAWDQLPLTGPAPDARAGYAPIQR